MREQTKFNFRSVALKDRQLVHNWLKKPHVAKWFYGQGLENTKEHLDAFLHGSSKGQYWLAIDKDHPFAFFITSYVNKTSDEIASWCKEKGQAVTLDMLIGDIEYLGKGLASILIEQFLLNQFPEVSEVLIDPEIANERAIHVYQKVGFIILGEFIPSYNPKPHYMMHLNMSKLKRQYEQN